MKINNFAMNYLVLFLIFSGIVEFRAIWHIIVLMLFGIVFLVNKSSKTDFKGMLILGIVTLLFIMSALLGDGYEYLGNNFRSSLYSLCAIGICIIITKKNKYLIFDKLTRNIKFFNIILVINIGVLFLQSIGTGFLIKTAWLAENPYYEDHCAGLFGKNSTNVLTLFSVFVMLLNLYYAKSKIKNKGKKRLFIVFTILSQGIMAVLSQFNDNIGFYFIFAIFFGFYILTSNYKDRNFIRKAVYVLEYVAVAIIAVVILYNIPSLNAFINDTVIDRLYRMFYYNQVSGGASGSSERFAIIEYALSQSSSFLFGTGVGSAQWIQAGQFGFAHFGINSAGSYIILGGVWFYLAYIVLYVHMFRRLLNQNFKSGTIATVGLVVIIIFFSIYTTLFNDARSVVSLILIFSSVNILYEEKTLSVL